MELPSSDSKTSKKSVWRTVKGLLLDYAAHSSIHGISYIAEKGRPASEKVWWITVLCLSIVGCGKMIFDVWHINPIIISFTETPTPIWQIPFPAITICPRSFARADRINITKFLEHKEIGENLYANLTANE